MTVTTLRAANRPQRYSYDGNRAVPIEDDEEQPAANPSPGAAIDLLKNLVELLTHPAEAKKRIAEFADAAAKANAASEQSRAERQNTEAAIASLARERAAQTKKLADEKLEHDAAMERRQRDVELRESAADKREAGLNQRETKLKADRTKLDEKLRAIKAAAE